MLHKLIYIHYFYLFTGVVALLQMKSYQMRHGALLRLFRCKSSVGGATDAHDVRHGVRNQIALTERPRGETGASRRPPVLIVRHLRKLLTVYNVSLIPHQVTAMYF